MKTTKFIGDYGEDKACDYLLSRGFTIIDRNWRTRYCEIDIVARKNECVYLVEVKTRSTSTFGSGLEYITSKKIKQMKFAAELWVQHNDWNGGYQLSAVSITDDDIEFLENLT